MSKNNYYIFSLVFLFFFIKFSLIIFFYNNPSLLYKNDSGNYLEILGLLNEDFLSYFEVPIHTNRLAGYPIFLFLLSKVSENVIFFILIQSILSCYTIIITYQICCLVVKNINKVLLFFIFFNLSLILYSTLILTEAIYIPIFYTFIYFFIKYVLYKKNLFFIISIIFLSISSVIRPTSFYLFFIICIFYFFISEKKIKNILSIFFSLLFLITINYPFIKKNIDLFQSTEQSTISSTMILEYWLPSIERYKYQLDYVSAKKKVNDDFSLYLTQNKFNEYSNPFSIQKQARSFFLKRLKKNSFFDIIKGFATGVFKSLFAPSYISYSHWLNIPYTSFYSSEGTNFIEQNLNYFFKNSNFYHGITVFFFLVFTFIIRILSFYGAYKIYSINKKIFFFFLIIASFFLLMNGSVGGPRHKLPFEFILILLTSISVADFLKFLKFNIR